MSATHVLHVTGKSIGREHGLQPIPVDLAADLRPAEQVLADVMVATVARCLPLAADPRVQWTSGRRAVVTVAPANGSRATRYVAARFTLKEAQ
jgi:hypothetical protein